MAKSHTADDQRRFGSRDCLTSVRWPSWFAAICGTIHSQTVEHGLFAQSRRAAPTKQARKRLIRRERIRGCAGLATCKTHRTCVFQQSVRGNWMTRREQSRWRFRQPYFGLSDSNRAFAVSGIPRLALVLNGAVAKDPGGGLSPFHPGGPHLAKA